MYKFAIQMYYYKNTFFLKNRLGVMSYIFSFLLVKLLIDVLS